MNKTQTLLDLKESIEEAEKEKLKLEGEKDSWIKVLKEESGMNTIKEAEQFITEETESLDKRKKILEDNKQKLIQNYEW
jgi:hypothetical protein